jgi:hypothetical protein
MPMFPVQVREHTSTTTSRSSAVETPILAPAADRDCSIASRKSSWKLEVKVGVSIINKPLE